MNQQLDLYAEDFESESVWRAVCDSVGVNAETATHIIIEYIEVKEASS